jgi:pyruvate formate lyase activating enzyme
MDEIKKDLPYYRRSGGGVTLSGGEALCQPEFAVALLKACQEYGINTARESTGYADFEVIKQYLPYLDVYLMDIKHMNSRKHEEFTSKPNELILENARKIAETGAHLIIRVPIIPSFNHLIEEVKEIAEFAKTLPGVAEFHLLPYHRLGQDKYEGLGREYTLSHLVPPSNEYMEELLEAANTSGLHCQIGG